MGLGLGKTARFNRRMAQMNFDLQKEYSEKNYQIALQTQQMQADQFDRMMEFNTPLKQREMMEEAGFNPFMDNAASGMSAPSSTASNPGSVMPPQYDLSSIQAMEQLKQSNLQTMVGSIGSLLDSLGKASMFGPSLKTAKAQSYVADLTKDVTVGMMRDQARITASDAAMAKVHEQNYPAELNALIQEKLMNANMLDAQAMHYDASRGMMKVNERYLNKQIDTLSAQIGEIVARTTGIKLDNRQKEIFNSIARDYYNAQIEQARSSAIDSRADAKLKEIDAFWSGMPSNYDQFVYANRYKGRAGELGIFAPGSLGDVLRTTRHSLLESRGSQSDLNRARFWHEGSKAFGQSNAKLKFGPVDLNINPGSLYAFPASVENFYRRFKRK